jgi:hypothetical protein
VSAAHKRQDDLARAIDLLAEVTQIVNGLRASSAPFYSQDNPPPGMRPRTYLEHCYRGSWENRREGRLRVTDVATYEAWNARRRVAAKVKPANEVEEIADEVEYIKSGGRRGR